MGSAFEWGEIEADGVRVTIILVGLLIINLTNGSWVGGAEHKIVRQGHHLNAKNKAKLYQLK